MSSLAPLNPLYPGIVIGSLLVALLVIERRVPLRTWRHPSLHRLVVNLAVSALAIGIALVVVRPAANFAIQTVHASRFGLRWHSSQACCCST